MENTSSFTKNNDYWILTIFYGIYRNASLFESVSNIWNHGVLKNLDGLLRFVFCLVLLFYTELLNATVNIKKNKIKMLSKFKKYPWKLIINSNKKRKILSVLNTYLGNATILYSLKTPENQKFCGVFKEYKMEKWKHWPDMN